MNLFPRFPKKSTPEKGIPAPKPPSFKPPNGKKQEQPSGQTPGFIGSSGAPSGQSDELVISARQGPGGGLPVWSSGGKGDKLAGVPLFRGLGGARSTLTDRIKGLKGRDLAFILAGLAVLVMAPLAEYLMMTPEDNGASAMKGGFAERGPMFSESNPYEGGPGGIGIAPGGLLGQDSDVITPLNVRDPSHLILGPGNEKAAPVKDAVASPPPKPPPAKDNWDDALKAAKTGASRAVQKTPGLPRPSGKLAGALRGLAALTGSTGGGPSMKLEPPVSKGLFGTPTPRSSLTRQTGGGFRSLAPGNGGGGYGGGRFGPASYGGGSTLDIFGRGGAEAGSGASQGRFSDGSETKNPGNNTNKDSKTTSVTPQENLALLRAKMEMEKAISLKWDKRRYDQLERKKMLEQIAAQTIAQTLQQALLKILDRILEIGKNKGGDKGKGKEGGKSPGGGSPGKGPGGGQPRPGGGQPGNQPPGTLPTPPATPPGTLPTPPVPGPGGPVPGARAVGIHPSATREDQVTLFMSQHHSTEPPPISSGSATVAPQSSVPLQDFQTRLTQINGIQTEDVSDLLGRLSTARSQIETRGDQWTRAIHGDGATPGLASRDPGTIPAASPAPTGGAVTPVADLISALNSMRTTLFNIAARGGQTVRSGRGALDPIQQALEKARAANQQVMTARPLIVTALEEGQRTVQLVESLRPRWSATMAAGDRETQIGQPFNEQMGRYRAATTAARGPSQQALTLAGQARERLQPATEAYRTANTSLTSLHESVGGMTTAMATLQQRMAAVNSLATTGFTHPQLASWRNAFAVYQTAAQQIQGLDTQFSESFGHLGQVTQALPLRVNGPSTPPSGGGT